jgi:hypothetical protein
MRYLEQNDALVLTVPRLTHGHGMDYEFAWGRLPGARTQYLSYYARAFRTIASPFASLLAFLLYTTPSPIIRIAEFKI